MPVPLLTFTDVSLLFAVGSIVLLITAELSSTYYGQTTLIINRRKLKRAAYVSGIIFLITAAVSIITILIG
jgi:hypothetical protein